MKNLTYFRKWLILAGWILVVIGIFRLISNRQIAALIAGGGFVLVPSYFLFDDWCKSERKYGVMLGYMQFLALFAVPIFCLRIIHWGVEFSTLQIFGVSAATLHKYANSSYAVMLLAVGISSWLEHNKKRQPKG